MNTRVYLLVLFLAYSVAAQAKDYPNCTYHYFKNKKVSTADCFDADKRWGKARAYNTKGELIYEKETRRIGGSASVDFSYYDNGAVKSAHYHSAPDGGIQWYNTTTEFSEDGKIVKEWDNNYNGTPGTTIQVAPQEKRIVKKDTARTVACAVIYSSEFWFRNTTHYTVVVDATRNASEHYSVTVKPGETVKGGQQIQAQYFDDPSKYYQFKVRPVDNKVKKRLIVIPSERKPENGSKEVRRYYFEVRTSPQPSPLRL